MHHSERDHEYDIGTNGRVPKSARSRRGSRRPRTSPRGRLLLAGEPICSNAWFSTELAASGFEIMSEPAIDLLAAYAAGQADLILINPDAKGPKAMAAIRRLPASVRARLVIVTWRPRWDVVDAMLRLGAADFVRMPTTKEELVLRVDAALRRARSSGADRDADDVGTADAASLQARIRAAVSPREWLLYSALAARVGDVVSRAEIRRVVWGDETQSRMDSNIVDVYVCYLRGKLSRFAPRESIETVRGAGYILRRARQA